MGDMPLSLDDAAFYALNALAGRWVAVDAFFIFGATYVIFVMIALIVTYVAVAWNTTHFEGRIENAACAFYAAVIGYCAEELIGFIWFRPRPFTVLDHAARLIEKSPHLKSFPSGHATVAFALAFAILLRNKRWGWTLVALAAFVGVSRVVVGVHYPSDIFGGLVVGGLSALAASPFKKAVEPYLDLFSVFRNHKRPSV